MVVTKVPEDAAVAVVTPEGEVSGGTLVEEVVLLVVAAVHLVEVVVEVGVGAVVAHLVEAVAEDSRLRSAVINKMNTRAT